MAKHWCEGHRNRYPDLACGSDATFFVTYFVDGGGGMYVCTLHLPQAVRQVADKYAPRSRRSVRVTEVNS